MFGKFLGVACAKNRVRVYVQIDGLVFNFSDPFKSDAPKEFIKRICVTVSPIGTTDGLKVNYILATNLTFRMS